MALTTHCGFYVNCSPQGVREVVSGDIFALPCCICGTTQHAVNTTSAFWRNCGVRVKAVAMGTSRFHFQSRVKQALNCLLFSPFPVHAHLLKPEHISILTMQCRGMREGLSESELPSSGDGFLDHLSFPPIVLISKRLELNPNLSE